MDNKSSDSTLILSGIKEAFSRSALLRAYIELVECGRL